MNTENSTKKDLQRSELAKKTIQKRKLNTSFQKKYNNQSHKKHKKKTLQKNTKQKKHKHNTIPELKDNDIRIIPLGGVEQVGQNMNIIETKDDIFIIDIGIQFSSEEETPGVDYLIPNIKYLLKPIV
jgi:ribonuclease J